MALFLTLESIPAITASADETDGGNILVYVWPLLFGTLLAAALAILVAAPLSIALALVISHYAPRRLAKPIGYAVDLLAAVPSVVYGLWGINFLAPASTTSTPGWRTTSGGCRSSRAHPAVAAS